MISITLESKELDYALTRLALAAKVDLGLVIKEEAKYLTQTLMKFTPPKSRPQGINAVRRDINRVADPLNYVTLQSKATKGGFYTSMAKYVRTRNVSKIQDLLNNPNFRYFYGKKLLQNEEEIKLLHRKLRVPRGNVAFQRDKALAFGRDFTRYRKSVEGAVGWHISGWIPAAKLTNARYKKTFDRFSGSGRARGNFTGSNPYVVAVAGNIKIPNYQRMVTGAVNSRISTTQKKIERILAKQAVNLGFIKINAPSVPQLEQAA